MNFIKPSKIQKTTNEFSPWVTSGSTHASISANKTEEGKRGSQGQAPGVSLAFGAEKLAREARRAAAQRKLELMRPQHSMGCVLFRRSR